MRRSKETAERYDCEGDMDNWIDSFVARPESGLYCAVDVRYIKDTFNLYDLREKMNVDQSRFRRLVQIIASTRPLAEVVQLYSASTNRKTEVTQKTIRKECKKLYGLIHARYICTNNGLQSVRHMFENGM